MGLDARTHEPWSMPMPLPAPTTAAQVELEPSALRRRSLLVALLAGPSRFMRRFAPALPVPAVVMRRGWILSEDD